MTYTVATMEVPREVYDLIRSKLEAAGYDHAIADDEEGMLDMTHIGLVPVDEPKTCTTRRDEGITVSSDVYWRYTQAPTGSKIFILNQGGVAITGSWDNKAGFLAWHPLFKRDKALEELLRIK